MSAAGHGVLLTLDRGNSHLDLMIHGAAPRRLRVQPDGLDPVVELIRAAGPERAVASSVVAGGLDQVAAILADLGIPLAVAGRDLPCTLDLDYPDPASLGTDRWLAGLAAWHLVGTAVVVDCGSAVTVDIVADHRFRGGAIAPGLWAVASGLAASAPGLPRFSGAEASPAMPATNSQECVDLGVLMTYAGGVDRLVAEALAVEPDATVVLTGGGAATYRGHARQPSRLVPDLVHRGLRCLATGSPGPF